MKCTYMDVSPLEDPKRFAALYRCIPWEDRRRKIDGCKMPADQRLSLGASLLLLHFLEETLPGSPSLLRFACGAHGKPCLPDYPQLHFNLSHSGCYAALIGGSRPCGVDVEKTRLRFDHLASRYFTAQEQLLLESSANGRGADPGTGSASKNDAFLRIWTRKESALKLTGEGITRDLRSVCVWPHPPEHRLFFEKHLPGHLLTACVDSCTAEITFEGFSEKFL